MQATIVVSAGVIRDGRILLVQEGKEICRGQWSLPGGRVEPGEGVAEAAVREVLEETGYIITIDGITPPLRYISQHGFHTVRFNFAATIIGGEPVIEGEEILDLRWMTFDEFAQLDDALLRTPGIARRAVNDLRNGSVHPLDFIYDAIGSGPIE
jgi:8-oxo-dGTP diphosphatase